MYVYKERLPGWYRWNRIWGREPTYAYIDDGIVAVKWTNDVEYIGVLPNNYEEFGWLDTEDDVLEIMTDDFLRSFVEPNAIYGRFFFQKLHSFLIAYIKLVKGIMCIIYYICILSTVVWSNIIS